MSLEKQKFGLASSDEVQKPVDELSGRSASHSHDGLGVTPKKKRCSIVFSEVYHKLLEIVGELCIDIMVQVVGLEVVMSFDKQHKIRMVVGADKSDPPQFIQISAWDLARDVFAASTSSKCLHSLPDSNFSSFTSLLGKMVSLKNVAVVAPPKDAIYNFGYVQKSLSFKGGSAVTIIMDTELDITGKQKLYGEYLADHKFNINEESFNPVSLATLKSSGKVSGIDLQLCVKQIELRRFVSNDVFQCIFDFHGTDRRETVQVSAWYIVGLHMNQFLNDSKGRIIHLQNVKSSRPGCYVFSFHSKIKLLRGDRGNSCQVPNSLKDLIGLQGMKSVNLHLQIISDILPFGSNSGSFVGIATDGLHKCQLCMQMGDVAEFGDQLNVHNASLEWSGPVLSVTIVSVDHFSVEKYSEETGEEYSVDELEYPKKDDAALPKVA